MPRHTSPEKMFTDRTAAGRELALAVRKHLAPEDNVVVLGLPRGGVPVAAEIASLLEAPLDIIVVRKVGFPGQEQLAMGAVASGGVVIRNEPVIIEGGVTESRFAAGTNKAMTEVGRYEAQLRGNKSGSTFRDRTVVIVDDGIATGSTVKAAIEAVRRAPPRRIIVATPVAPADTLRELGALADDVVCLSIPKRFIAVGVWYRDFPQVPSRKVREILESVD